MDLTTLIIDDDSPGANVLAGLLHKAAGIRLLGAYRDWEAASGEAPDLVFCIRNGWAPEAAASLEEVSAQSRLVLVSADPAWMEAAFEVGAVDFLRLPVSPQRLEKTLERVRQRPERRETGKPYFFVKSDYKIVRVQLDGILFIEALGEYVRIHTESEKLVTLLPLHRLESFLPADTFLRIHRSYIINLDKVHFIQNNVVSIGSHQLPISKGQRKAFLDYLIGKGLLE